MLRSLGMHKQLSALLGLALTLTMGGCSGQERQTSPSLRCEGCEASALDAGTALIFDASWLGTAWDTGPFPSDGKRDVCDPFRVEIRCEGVSCETTRGSQSGEFWSLEQAMVTEPSAADDGWSCLVGMPEQFAVRPTSGGELVIRVVIHNLRTDEEERLEHGPITVHPPTIAPEASCDDCDRLGRVGVGVPFPIHARWDGKVGGDDPIGRQPFVLSLDCGAVACEARPIGWSASESSGWEPLAPMAVPARPASQGIELEVRALEPGEMTLRARLEHAQTHEVVAFDLGTVAQRQVDALEVLCLGGELCGEASGPTPAADFGVVGLAGAQEVYVDATVRYSRNGSPSAEPGSCSPEPYLAADGAEISTCATSLYAVDGATSFTLYATWGELSAELTVPTP